MAIGFPLNVTSKLRAVPHKYSTISQFMVKKFDTRPERRNKVQDQRFPPKKRVFINTNVSKNNRLTEENFTQKKNIQNKKILKKNVTWKNIQSNNNLKKRLRIRFSVKQRSTTTTMKTKFILVGFLLYMLGCYNVVNCLSSLGSGSLRNTKQINKAVVSCFSYSLKYWDLEFWTSLKNLPFSILVHPK